MLKHYPLIKMRAGTTHQWGPRTSDTELNYKETTVFGPNLYNPSDIEYKFNTHGFRCDEFDLSTELPILFIGCSVTEGVGIKQHETWAYQLLTNIRNKTGKNIPYWNIALAGHGVDTNANCLHWFINNITRPKFIFAHLPPFTRREFSFESDMIDAWAPWFLNKNVDHIFTDTFFEKHQARRSMMLIESIQRVCNATMFCSTWSTDIKDHDIIKEFSDILYVE